MREGRSSRPPSASGSATLIASNIALEGHNSPIVLTDLSRELRECGEMYLTWCHKQPMELFDEETFMSSLSHRDQELILALQALGSRFPPGSLTKTKQDHLESLAKDSRQMVMDKVVKGETTLSSIQTLCILSCYNFTGKKSRSSISWKHIDTVTAGHIEKARLDLTVANHLKSTYYAETNEIHDRETRLCLRSIESLCKIYGCPEQATRLMSVLRDRTEGRILPDILGFHPDLDTETDLYGELGGFASRLGDTWQMIRAYALSRVGLNSAPPWDSRSDYNIVMQSHLRIDCAVPIKYRFSAETDMNNQDPEALQRHRKHWSALLFLHIVYAIVPCVLNHPFLLSMRLRNFRNIIPQSFVQQSYDHITRHAGWITYYISAAERKNFQPTDPCLAHCVAIVATIYIQHSFVETVHLRERAQAGLETCLRFLDRMGLIWPMVANMVSLLLLPSDLILRNIGLLKIAGGKREEVAAKRRPVALQDKSRPSLLHRCTAPLGSTDIRSGRITRRRKQERRQCRVCKHARYQSRCYTSKFGRVQPSRVRGDIWPQVGRGAHTCVCARR